ncbi:MAG: C-terminal helicase domain-containing protein [Bacillota bacterium]
MLVEMISRELKEDVLFFHGGLPRTKRDKLVEDFQGGGRHPVLIVSLKAGGTGLNLTAATNVIHYDLWWNPAVEAQATDRTYRIGQTKKVIVYRLITLGTFEEKIDEMLKLKKELAEMTVSAGEQWLTELSDRELLEIFKMAGNNHRRPRR